MRKDSDSFNRLRAQARSNTMELVNLMLAGLRWLAHAVVAAGIIEMMLALRKRG